MMFLPRTVMPLLSLIILVCACDTPVEVKQSCGDGFIDPGEACDGDNLATRNCEQLGYYSGTGPIVCTADCQMDLSPCGGRCGDGQIQTQYGEECDGAELGESTCVDQGMGSGVLACSSACRFDLSGCAAAAVCGDGLVATPAEECEPGDLQGQTCFTLGYYGGNLACGGDCRFDLASCQAAGRCGDGTLHADFGEICDGYSLGGVTCEELNYHGGTLACATDCTFDLASCVAAGRCGDGVLQDDAGEQCDLDDLGPQTCEDLYPGYGGGALACAADCTLDPAGCARCGDGLLQTSQGELCDGDALDGATCETQGQYPGTLACAADCAELVLDGCGGSCGDGVVQEAFLEDCETGLPVNTSCALQGLGLGALGCTSACAYDTAACLRASSTGGGASSSCALLEDGTVRCWGRNDQGTLGDGTTSTRTLPVAVSGLSGATLLAGGISNHVCVVRTGGAVNCWGLNDFGQLGNGSVANATTPVTVSGLSDAVQVSVGGWSTCARRATGAVVCWGNNGWGQLGDGTETSSTVPVQVSGITSLAVDVAVGYEHACAVLANGSVLCWGKNLSGQLGDGTATHRTVPVPVLTQATPPIALSQAARVVAGHEHTCSIRSGTGALHCWGRNDFGQLGDGTTTNRSVAVSVMLLTSVTAASGGYNHTCAVSGGSVSCWGDNAVGQLGLGDTNQRPVPTAVAGLAGVTGVFAGVSHTCAILDTGVVRCTGGNALGQLGDGTTNNRLTPGFVQ